MHGLPVLRRMPNYNWLEVAMIWMNHKWTLMDGPTYTYDNNPNDVSEVVEHIKNVHRHGLSVISMKLAGAAAFTRHADRQEAMRFAFRHVGVDAVTVSFKNTQEIHETISNLNSVLA